MSVIDSVDPASTSPIQVILAEDDVDLCEAWTEVFDVLGHRLTCFNTGKEALDAIHPLSEFDFLVSDYYLPDLNGVEVIRRAREVKPSIPAMLLTGSREPEIAQAALRIPNVMVRYKPFGLEDFERCLGEVAGLKRKLKAAQAQLTSRSLENGLLRDRNTGLEQMSAGFAQQNQGLITQNQALIRHNRELMEENVKLRQRVEQLIRELNGRAKNRV